MSTYLTLLRWRLLSWPDRIARWIAWHLPARVVLWAGVLIAVHATSRKYDKQVVPDLTAMDALKRWWDDKILRPGN